MQGQLKNAASHWPIDNRAGEKPEYWHGWPLEHRFALILTHDVDTAVGQSRCVELARMEMDKGFRSFFSFVPERYDVSASLRHRLKNSGFEIAVHGLKHDCKLFKSRSIFRKRAAKINRYIDEWDVAGFRSPSMQHNLDWLHELNIEYDSSTFDTDPFEPQPNGVSTIFPFWVPHPEGDGGYSELPYTLPQDSTLFIFLQEQGIDTWKTKLDWIAEHGGMALLNSHPDYMSFNGNRPAMKEYPAKFYSEFLDYVKQKYDGQYWHALPRDVAKLTAAYGKYE
jgi:hypothetical protein